MISRINIEDMTDAQDEAPERIWAQPEHSDEPDYGGFWIKAKVAPAVEYVRADLARPSQAGDERVARLIRAVECERNHKSAYDATPQDRGGHKGPKGQAYQLWMDARADVGAALAAMDTPKGGGDE